MKQSQYDIAFIGTSPISMLKAYILAKKQPEKSIILIDGYDNIGGAWYSDLSPKGHEIECGCHIWSYSPEVYGYLEKELEIPLYNLKPDAIFVGKNIKVPYSIKNSVDTYKFIAKNILTAKFKKLKEVKSNPALKTKIINKKNKYPKLGSPELVNALIKKLKACSNVAIKNGTKVTKIDTSDKVKLTTNQGDLFCDKIYLTSVSEIEEIKTVKKVIKIENRQVDYIHFLISLNKPLLKKVFYWRIMADDIIHRISDISYQTKNEEQLLLIGIKGDGYYKHEEDYLLDYCKQNLLNLKLINNTFEVKKVKTHIFPTYYIDGEIRKEIAELDKNKLELIHSTDIIYGMHFLLEEEGLI